MCAFLSGGHAEDMEDINRALFLALITPGSGHSWANAGLFENVEQRQPEHLTLCPCGNGCNQRAL